MIRPFHAAIDLGAGSGRVFVGAVDPGNVHLHEAHRFYYAPRRVDGHLRWDVARLFDGLREGLHRASACARDAGGELQSAGVDAWGVDYGLVDEEGSLVEEPICYRDERTAGMMERVFARVPREEIFAATGIQFLALNTLYQLAAHVSEGLPARARRLLLIPDLCHHFLCGAVTGERTNASTTQLLDVRDGEWQDALFARLGLPRSLMPDLVDAGTDLGLLRAELGDELGLAALRVFAPATHDTASAVAGTPHHGGWAYISSGTWSLVGVERNEPLLGAAVLAANFTNERGVAGTFRLLKNVMGLWILESCRREWRELGVDEELPQLLQRTRAIAGVGGLIFPDAARFFNPRSMIAELSTALAETGQPVPDDPAALTKVVLDSLALRYAEVVAALESMTGREVPGVHITGGGALNTYLNQATANATGRPVVAGPVEAAAMGNVLIQAVACHALESVAEGRRLVARALPLRRFEPEPSAAWREAADRYRELKCSVRL